ncbi:MAG: DUF1800 family protein, partial [bacterium]
AVTTWMAKQKDPHQLREVVRTIVTSPHFTKNWGAKVKRPNELAVSFFRATGADLRVAPEFIRGMENLGWTPFNYPAPTGHPDVAPYWLSTNGMLGRWNFLQLVFAKRQRLAAIDLAGAMPQLANAESAIDHWSDRLLGMPLATPSKQAILSALPGSAAPTGDSLNLMVALIAMTPEFQRR